MLRIIFISLILLFSSVIHVNSEVINEVIIRITNLVKKNKQKICCLRFGTMHLLYRYLIIQYRNTEVLKKINIDDLESEIFVSEYHDVYIKKTNLELFTVAKYVHPYYGTCNRFLV